jgi:hypothetical protein
VGNRERALMRRQTETFHFYECKLRAEDLKAISTRRKELRPLPYFIGFIPQNHIKVQTRYLDPGTTSRLLSSKHVSTGNSV